MNAETGDWREYKRLLMSNIEALFKLNKERADDLDEACKSMDADVKELREQIADMKTQIAIIRWQAGLIGAAASAFAILVFETAWSAVTGG